jgi:hypothetical protein
MTEDRRRPSLCAGQAWSFDDAQESLPGTRDRLFAPKVCGINPVQKAPTGALPAGTGTGCTGVPRKPVPRGAGLRLIGQIREMRGKLGTGGDKLGTC